MMKQLFPGENMAVVACPHCRGERQFHYDQGKGDLLSNVHHAGPDNKNRKHMIRAAFCSTCGRALIRYTISRVENRGQGDAWYEHSDVIYPVAALRSPAPDVVRTEDADLADDYDEAVACEPHSLKAAVFLLGRCMERILTARCKVEDDGRTLGPMIDEAIRKDSVPDHLQEPLKESFVACRNQGSHIWKTANGEELNVEPDNVAGSFAVMDEFFRHFYVARAGLDAFNRRMKDVKDSRAKKEKTPKT